MALGTVLQPKIRLEFGIKHAIMQPPCCLYSSMLASEDHIHQAIAQNAELAAHGNFQLLIIVDIAVIFTNWHIQ